MFVIPRWGGRGRRPNSHRWHFHGRDPPRSRDKLRGAALARRSRGTQTREGGRRGAGQQDRTNRLGGAGQGGNLSPAGDDRSREVEAQRFRQGECEVMQDRSNTGDRENPSWLGCPEHAQIVGTRSADRMRASDHRIAQTGRTHSCTRPACITATSHLAKPGPSTHSQELTLDLL